MAPQRAPGYSAPNGAQPVYGQQGAYSSLNQGLNVPVGIPAGVAAGYGPSAHSGNTTPAGAPPFHVGNGLPGSLHGPMGSMGGGNPQMGAFPGFPTQVAYPHYVQAQQQNSIIQPPTSNHGYENPAVLNIPGQWQGNPIRSPHSSCPPGFEPHHNNSIAMGIPTQTNLVNGATGTGAVNGNQHQVQQQHQNQVQHFQAHPPQQQVQSPSLHQQQQFQNLHLHQHHHNNNQRQHVLHHQSQNQHRQFQQEQNQHQKRYRQFNHRHRQRDVQHEYQQKHQDQHESNQQLYIQNGCQQKQQGQHERQHSWQLHSQSHVQSQAQPQLQLHSHHKPQCQPQSQSHLSCQQVQPSPAFQACITNGVALGVPVMPTHNSTNAISVKDSAQNQQHAPSWKHTIQSENSQINVKFLAANNIEQEKCSLPNYSEEIPHMYAEESTNFHRDGALHSKDPSCEEVQSRSSSMANSHSGMEDMGPGNAVRNGHTKMKIMSGTNHHNFIEGESRKLQSPQKMQFHSGPSSRSRPNDRRNNQPRFNGQFKAHNKPFQVSRQNIHNHFGSQRQTLDSQGNSFSKGPGKRSDVCTFRCEPCDRMFTTSEFLSSHIKSHVKCGENGCSFEAAGKVVKEHRVVEHRKVDFQSTSRGRRALAMRLREDHEEIRRWREERKRSYPTSQNILRKAEAKRKREAEGESIDEESQLRRQQLLDIIKKQRQLGFEPAEIPSYYFRTQSSKKRKTDNKGLTVTKQESAIEETLDRKSGDEWNGDATKVQEDRLPVQKKLEQENGLKDMDHNENHSKDHQRNDHLKKGHHKKFTSWKDHKRSQRNSNLEGSQFKRPSLLSKLLRKDIESEKSQFLQCCRFIVNNAFLQNCPPTSLKHFPWTERVVCGSGSAPLEDLSKEAAQLMLDGKDACHSSDSKHSACPRNSYQSGEITKNISESDVSDSEDDVIAVKSEDGSDTSFAFAGHLVERTKHQDLVDAKSRVQSTEGIWPLQSGVSGTLRDAKDYHTITDKMTQMQASSCWKSMLPPSQNVGAGIRISGNIENAIEDDDISQYMNLDLCGA